MTTLLARAAAAVRMAARDPYMLTMAGLALLSTGLRQLTESVIEDLATVRDTVAEMTTAATGAGPELEEHGGGGGG